MKKILIVDDEVQILKTMSRLFLETNYEIHTAENSMDALKLLENTNMDMVISDMRMPEYDGYQLLSTIKEKYPKIIRIILSGYADEKPMFRALLHNVAKLYVFKPWNNNDFLRNIDKLFADENELNSDTFKEKFKSIRDTSIIPLNCEKMFSHIENENIEELITEIEQDADISKLLIQVAKSAVYGAMPNTVKQAAIYIGLHNLKSFMRYACIINSLKLNSQVLEEADLLCRHSCLTSRIFLFLFEAFLHKQPTDSAMFAGLLHNIGLIIMTHNTNEGDSLKKQSLSVNEYAKLDSIDNEIMHQELGAHFIDQWDLPFPMYEVALYHHRPLNANVIHHDLVSSVHIAKTYAWKTLGAEVTPVDPKVFETLGMQSADFEKRLSRYLKSQANGSY